jgi:hypothetical protein
VNEKQHTTPLYWKEFIHRSYRKYGSADKRKRDFNLMSSEPFLYKKKKKKKEKKKEVNTDRKIFLGSIM